MARSKRAFWVKQFYVWHWVSSAICLFSMLLFAFTGITLNHAGQIQGSPEVTEQEAQLPVDLLAQLEAVGVSAEGAPLPREIRDWIDAELSLSIGGRRAEWSEHDVYISLPRPGGDAWLSLDRETGEVFYENTRRGAIAYLNDLHKGRNTGAVWSGFLDVFSVASVIFCLTGLGLLWTHARRRPMTWPVVLAGIALPVLLAAFFIVH